MKDELKEIKDKLPEELQAQAGIETDIVSYLQAGYTKNEILELLSQLHRFTLPTKQTSTDFAPTDFKKAEIAAQVVLPYIEKARIDLFRSKEQPFVSLEKAAAWIGKEAKRDIKEAAKRKPHIYLAYPVSHQDFRRSPVLPDSLLGELREACERLGKALGWQEQQSVAYLLCGLIPVLPKAKIQHHWRSYSLPETDIELDRHWVTVHVYDSALTVDQLKDIRKKARKRMQTTKKKEPSEENLELVLFVLKNASDIEAKTKVAFWEQMRDQWLIEHPKTKKRTYWAVRRGFERTCESLGLPRIEMP